MTLFKKTPLALIVIATLMAAPAAMASSTIDPAQSDLIRNEMTAQGYEVRKIAMEDGLFEVYAIKDGKTYEVYLDADLKIVRIKG